MVHYSEKCCWFLHRSFSCGSFNTHFCFKSCLLIQPGYFFFSLTSEFEEDGNLLETNREATTINIEDEDVKRQTKAPGFVHDAEDEYSAHSDDREEVRPSMYRKIVSFALESVDSSGLFCFH